jgi:uncharacterized protein (DUF1501 family)
MLRIIGKRDQVNGKLSRRSFLRIGAIGPLGLTLADYLALCASARTGGGHARSVILLWLWGAPSQLDTFDMKPDAPIEYRGPFVPIATKVPGLSICELLPNLARCADKFALVRTMHHDETDHGIAGTMGLTGSRAGASGLGGASIAGAERPSTGAIVGRLHRGRPGSIPPYVILGDLLHQGKKRVVGEGGGTLGSAYDPFRLRYEPGAGVRLPDAQLPESVSAARLEARWDLRRQLDGGITSSARPAARFDRHYDLAHTLIASSQSLSALDVEREPASVRHRYGLHRFGQCCLIARRLVEAGQPFVQVNWSTHVEAVEDSGDGGWDMHDRYFAIMQEKHGWMFDRALSALIDDLDRRGLLETTLVVAVGEFGRSPKINDRAGREHHPQCYTALLAGGGVQGGRVIGTSDKRAERPVDRAFSPADLGTTILARLGIGAADLTGINLTPDGQAIEELF